LKPKIASVGKAILFPSAVEALGKNGNNLSSEVWWTPHHPFKSSLTGQSAKALSDAYEKSSGKQWTQPIGFVHSLFEVAVDVMKRTSGVGDNKAIVKSIASTKLDTVVGPIAWDGKNVPPFAAKNITKTPLVGGQWRHREGNKYDIVITDNKTFPAIPWRPDATDRVSRRSRRRSAAPLSSYPPPSGGRIKIFAHRARAA
jgi:branched-chain amino acid transport system substrate-binding protein